MANHHRPLSAARALMLAALGATALGASSPPSPVPGLPPIVFVSRRPIGRDPRAGVPGLGPNQRGAIRGGRLMLRRPNGRVVPLLPAGRFIDVADPSVSFDGTRIAFAAVTRSDSAWRIWVVDGAGCDPVPVSCVASAWRIRTADAARHGLVQVTRTDRALDRSRYGGTAGALGRYDDLDPCWLPDGRLCFSSTRYPYVAETGGLATNLFIVHADGSGLCRITADRDGADEPGVDPSTGRIVYARWWGSRYRPSNVDPSGITTDRAKALGPDRLIVWHALTIRPDGGGMKLAGGYPLERTRTMAYQPVLFADGTLVGVTADTLSLEPIPGRVRLACYPGGFAAPVTFPDAPAQMCSPAPLPDGRLIVAYDPNGRGDFDLAVVNRDGSGLIPLARARGTLELDPVALVARPLPPVLVSGLGGLPRAMPVREPAELEREPYAVRFDCLNVFGNAPVDVPIPDAPAMARDVRIRFFTAFSRPASAGGDTVAFLREAEVERSGAIHQDLAPGDVPMFEQLIDAHGHVLESASGPAHVPGFNWGRTGGGTQCVGCHTGHSAIAVAQSYAAGKQFNAAPSATVSVSSQAQGTRAQALVDRRTRGDRRQVAWLAAGGDGEVATLRWAFPIAVDSLIVYAVRPDTSTANDLALSGCDVAFKLGDRLVKTLRLDAAIDVDGSAIGCGGVVADRVEIRPRSSQGPGPAGRRVGLAEVQAVARIPED